MKENYAGIDYGRGMSNIDHDTGIRYGVIHQNEVLQAWADSSEPDYGMPICPECGYEYKKAKDPKRCPDCGYVGDDFWREEALGYYYVQDGYQAACGDDEDIFITKSKYFTYAQFCSPCAPGAGYLMNPFVNYWKNTGTNQEGIMAPEDYPDDYKLKAENAGYPKVYCFDHDWFEDGKAPYPVFSVETGEIVLPVEK